MNNHPDARLLQPLKPLLDNQDVTEIVVDGFERVYVRRHGKLEDVPSPFRNQEHLMQVINDLLEALDRQVNRTLPLVNVRLPDGSWVNVVLPPVAATGAVMTIQRFPQLAWIDEDWGRFGASSEDNSSKFLEACIRARVNIVVSGSVEAGRTMLLNILAGMMPDDECSVVIEDRAELVLPQRHCTRLVASSLDVRVEQRDLVLNALRMRPDRVVIKEAKGSEIFDLICAMNAGYGSGRKAVQNSKLERDLLHAMSAGHDGILMGVNASSPQEALIRLEMMAALANPPVSPVWMRQQIVSAIDLVVHTARMRDGFCRIISITEVSGLHEDTPVLSDIFRFQQTGFEGKIVLGQVAPTGQIPCLLDRIRGTVIAPPSNLFNSPL